MTERDEPMLEKMKSVSNPLTIIGLFCGVVEVVGLIVMGTGKITPEAQRDLIWLVKWFPLVLVSLFCITLWFKDRVLYAPGDFKDEKNYLDLARLNARKSVGIDEIRVMLDEAVPDIINEVMKTVPTNGATERQKIEEIVGKRIWPVQSFASKLKEDTDPQYSWLLALPSDDRSRTFNLWMHLDMSSEPMTLKEIASKLDLHEYAVSSILALLIARGVVKEKPDEGNGKTYYYATASPINFVWNKHMQNLFGTGPMVKADS